VALAHITDLVTRAVARMLIQYKSKAKFVADVSALVTEAQQAEDAFWAFYEQLDLDVAQGVWLDRLGGLVGQGRDGETDETQFLDFIKARILANKSQGTSNELLAIVLQAFAQFGFAVSIVDWYAAAQTITINQDIQLGFPEEPQGRRLRIILKILSVARAVSVQTTLRYQCNDDVQQFVMGDSLGSDPTGLGFDDAASPDDPSAGQWTGADAA
jgi:hypothetical protein